MLCHPNETNLNELGATDAKNRCMRHTHGVCMGFFLSTPAKGQGLCPLIETSRGALTKSQKQMPPGVSLFLQRR